MGDRLNWVEGELARLQEEGGLDDAYAVQVTAYLAIIKKGKSRHLVQAQHHWRSLLLVSSVALISVYSVAWHCMNSLARALASTLTLMGYNQTQEGSSVFL